jgi:hypothetical protein
LPEKEIRSGSWKSCRSRNLKWKLESGGGKWNSTEIENVCFEIFLRKYSEASM